MAERLVRLSREGRSSVLTRPELRAGSGMFSHRRSPAAWVCVEQVILGGGGVDRRLELQGSLPAAGWLRGPASRIQSLGAQLA